MCENCNDPSKYSIYKCGKECFGSNRCGLEFTKYRKDFEECPLDVMKACHQIHFKGRKTELEL